MVKYASSYMSVQLQVSVAFATIIGIHYKNNDKAEQLSKLRK